VFKTYVPWVFWKKQGLTLTCWSTCPSDKEDTENIVLFDARKHFTKMKCIFPIPLLQIIRQIMITFAYWLVSLSKPVSKYNTAPLWQKKAITWLAFQSQMSRNVHVLCSCRKQSLSYCWLQMIFNWANNSLTSKGYEQNVHTWLHAALALISKQVHLLPTTAVNTVQFKVNGTDPNMTMVYFHTGLLHLYLVMLHMSV
jgi:hypothetical protein